MIDLRRRLAVTNQHVVGNHRTVRVYFPRYRRGKVLRRAVDYMRKGRPVAGRVLATDKVRDLALIRLQRVPRGVRQLPLAPERPGKGEALYSVGNSGGGKDVRTGHLWKFRWSRLRQHCFARLNMDVGLTLEACVLILDAGFDHGDSGGPLVNRRGQLVGVVDGFNTANHHLGYCIDAGEVRQFLERTLGRRRELVSVDRLAGAWKATFVRDGKEMLLGVNFQPDGRVEMIGAKIMKGRYRLTNEVLRLDLDTDPVHAEGSVTWEGDKRFSVTWDGTQFTFQRR
jgi:hypothetical protein